MLSLTLLALLVLLGLMANMLVLIESQASRSAIATARARLNAIAASRIALGEMQRLLGPDRRVTANADILRTAPDTPVAQPKLAGVWRGGVVSGNYAGAHRDAFLGWLSSGTADNGWPLTAATGATTKILEYGTLGRAGSASWPLLTVTAPHAGAPALRNPNETAATLSLRAASETFSGDPKDASAGAFAWVAMDENQKARVDLHDYRDDGLDNRMRTAFASSASARFHPGHAEDHFAADWSATLDTRKTQPGWRDLVFDVNAAGIPWAPVDTAAGAPVAALRHDFTTDSVSLLTDTANGGLKRDVNLLALMSESDFNALPGIGHAGPASQGWLGEDPDRQAWLTPKVLGDLGGKLPWGTPGEALVFPIWSDLRRWAKFPTSPVVGGSEAVVIDNAGYPFVRMPTNRDMADHADNVLAGDNRKRTDGLAHVPVIHRIRIEYTYESIRKNAKTYTLVPRINFVIQIWNPYSVRLKMPWGNSRDLLWLESFNPPMMVKLHVNGAVRANTNLVVGNIEYGLPLYDANSPANELAPGEIRTYTVPTYTGKPGGMNTGILVSGYNPGGGILLQDPAHAIDVAATDTVAYSVERTTQPGYRTYLGGFNLSRGTLPTTTMSNGITTYLADFGGITSIPAHSTWLRLLTPASTRTTLGPAATITPQKCAILDIRLKSEKTAVTGACLTEIPTLHQMFLKPRDHAGDQSRAYNRVAYEWVGWDAQRRNDPDDPNDLQVTDRPNHPRAGGYGLTGYTPATGLANPVFYNIPLTPPLGLLDLRHARLTGGTRPTPVESAYRHKQADSETLGYSVHEAFGNSLAHYAVPQPQTALATVDHDDFLSRGMRPLDYSWLLNTMLADTWFASSLGDWNRGATKALFTVKKDYPALLADLFNRGLRLPNRRLAPMGGNPSADWVAGSYAHKDAFREAGARLAVEGGFNINSTSVRAWRAFLASSRDAGLLKLDPAKELVAGTSTQALIKSLDYPIEEPAQAGVADNDRRINGGRQITEPELDTLAKKLVAEIRLRGPFLSLGEFLNRRIESGELGVKGAVQAAIDAAGLNDGLKTSGRALANLNQLNPDAAAVYHHAGVGRPGWVGQAQLLAPLATALTPRGDTFTVRVAAESGAGAREHLELTLRRSPDFLDPAEAAETEVRNLNHNANKAFGRRLVIVAARRLRADEIESAAATP